MSKTSDSGKGTQPFSAKMKAVGRGVARANQQKSSATVPSHMSSGGGSKPYGGGQYRTGAAQTKAKDWKGVT